MAYTVEEREQAFKKVANRIQNGEALRNILKDMRLGVNTFYAWLDKYEDLRERYARATDIRADKIFEEIIAIADDSTHDELITEKGVQFNSEYARRSQIRIDARKWVLGKMRPSKYGDKLDITSGNEKMHIPAITGMIIKNEIPADSNGDDSEYDLV